MAGELSLKTPLTGLVTLVPTNTATDKTITLPATTGTMVVQDGTNTTTVTNLSASSITDSGNLNFTGTGNRITGDFSNATVASRVMFQTNTANASTSIYIIPNGTNTTSQFVAVNNSDPTNASLLQLLALNTDIQLRSGITGSGTFLPMSFWTSGGEKMRIDTSGNVGIGTSSPLAKLQVYPTVGAPASSGNLNTGVIFAEGAGGPSLNMGNFNSGGTYYAWIQSAFVNNAAVVQPLVLQQIGGNVGIGTVSPSGKLDVVGGRTFLAAASEPYACGVRYVSTGGAFYFGASDGTATPDGVFCQAGGSERMRITNSGNVLVGTSTSLDNTNGAKLEPPGTAGYPTVLKIMKTHSGAVNGLLNYHSGSYVGGINFDNTSTSFPTSSDIRLKKDIVDAPSALLKVQDIRIVSHGWKHDDGVVEFGVIAQELVSVAPSAVTQGDDGEEVVTTWSVDYSKLVPILTKAIQELTARLEVLENK